MATLQERIVGALGLETRTFEEVEADQTATSQALAVVVLAGASTAIGVAGLRPGLLVATLIAAIVGWLLWSLLTFLIGAKLLPERDTNVDIGQMLRVLGFAAAPGLFGILGIIPFLGGVDTVRHLDLAADCDRHRGKAGARLHIHCTSRARLPHRLGSQPHCVHVAHRAVRGRRHDGTPILKVRSQNSERVRREAFRRSARQSKSPSTAAAGQGRTEIDTKTVNLKR